jgi:hypothetical protein
MGVMRDAGRHHDHLLQELAEERVAALTRISRTLESLIAQLGASREQLQHLDGPRRDRELERYREMRARALRYRWYLDVQREALGLRHHSTLDDFYRVPGPVG